MKVVIFDVLKYGNEMLESHYVLQDIYTVGPLN